MPTSNFPRVSIITPSYNQAAYLEATLQSVLSQEYANLEYLVVDGGSTDGSAAIIERYADRLAWWVSEPDQGQADAINKGLGRATGEIVAWLNSDDLYRPGAIRWAVETMQANPGLGLVYADVEAIDAAGKVVNTISYQQYDLDDLLAFRIIGQPSVFMCRSVLEQAGLLQANFHYLLDHHLWIRMARLAGLQYVPKVWSAARYHPEAKNVAQPAAFGLEVYRILEWAKAQTDLAEHIQANPRRVQGGAHRLAARYLLDGGDSSQALATYFKALRKDPAYTLQHWHRMVYAFASMLGLGGLLKKFAK
ncbi:MAG: glycosyltransferase [Anaerolineales bacterium]|nr:glycosyltransferase [Anaerolineales bacterium]